MPQLQNLVLTDRAATPVNHTFTPLDIKDGIGAVVETTGVPIGNNKFTIGLSKTAGGKYRATANLTVPIVVNETVNGVSRPAIARTGYAKVEFTFDESSSEQERKDLVGMLASSLDASKALVNDTIVKLQGVY